MGGEMTIHGMAEENAMKRKLFERERMEKNFNSLDKVIDNYEATFFYENTK